MKIWLDACSAKKLGMHDVIRKAYEDKIKNKNKKQLQGMPMCVCVCVRAHMCDHGNPAQCLPHYKHRRSRKDQTTIETITENYNMV